MAVVVAFAACGGDPPPALTTAPPVSDEVPKSPSVTDAAAESGHDYWFASGPGYEAIVARQRGNHERARQLLDALLAQPDLDPGDRAAAELLRGLESIGSDDADAAKRLATARGHEAMAPIGDALRAMEARAWLDAGEPAKALEVAEGLTPGAGVPMSIVLLRADALARTNKDAEAERAYRDYLDNHATGAAKTEARIKLARVLVHSDDRDKRAEAVKLFDRIVLDAPLTDYGTEAKRASKRLVEDGVVKRSSEEAKKIETARALSRAQALLDRRSYESAVTSVDNFLDRKKRLGYRESARCTALYIKGSAIFKQRRRTDARPVFEDGAKSCRKAKNQDLEVKCRYQAARGRYATGEYSKAGREFEALARDHAGHSYADDALVKAGESWESAGKPEEARRVLEHSLADHADGDMAGDARRRLLLQAFVDQRYADALKLADAGIAARSAHGSDLAKLHYFRGRALAKLGRSDDAHAAYLAAIEERPLSYPSLQALSRLRDESDAAFAEGVAAIEQAPKQELPSFDLPSGDASARIALLAKLGLGSRAKRELDGASITGWPAVAALDRAGLWTEAQKTLANRGSGWRSDGPSGQAERLWHFAHPRPFRDIIDAGEKDNGVPDKLTFAIMQTESRFNPGAVSWAGARGLIQIMPKTAEGLAKKTGIPLASSQALHDPQTNLGLGMWHLARLSERFGGTDGSVALAIPSYNAGAGSVDKWLAVRGEWDLDLFIEAIPFDETRRYTQTVLGRWLIYRWLYSDGAAADRVPYLPVATPHKA